MFESSKLKINDKLITECVKLIEEHNKLSYQKISFTVPLVLFEYINSKHNKQQDPISKEIIKFYEKYASQMLSVVKIKTIIDTISYTSEDLSIHIDRSPDSILQIFSSLTEIRVKLTSNHEHIIENVESDASSFIDYVLSLIDTKTDFDEVISTIYICMKQHGLNERIDSDLNNRPFIYVGSNLIEMMYKSNLLTPQRIQLIADFNNDLKQTVLGANYRIRPNATTNRLQTFGLVPDEGPNINLKTVIEQLFGLDMELIGSVKEVIDPLTKTLKLVTADTGISTGLIIILSPNEDTCFDMTNLQNISQSNGSSGINEEMIKTFDLIYRGNKPVIKHSELLTIGIDLNVTQMAYVLWSNDLKTFKIKSQPIHGPTISKLVRNAPSATIEAYNAMMEESIVNNRTEDVISFNRVKYMSFNDTVTEESFLTKFQNKLVSAIMNSIGKLGGKKMHDAVVDEKFTTDMLDTIDSAKVDLGIHPQLFSSHCNIIYASMANRIVNKLKKELLVISTITKSSVSDIVKLIIETNDNIYSRIIASYYLHIA